MPPNGRDYFALLHSNLAGITCFCLLAGYYLPDMLVQAREKQIKINRRQIFQLLNSLSVMVSFMLGMHNAMLKIRKRTNKSVSAH